jgi:hypothetical protein
MTTLPYQSHSSTSHQAAIEAESSASTLRSQVFRFIVATKEYGATDEEIQDYFQMNPSTQRPRRVELVNRKLVMDSGMMRKTKAGRNATVWVERRGGAEQLRLL